MLSFITRADAKHSHTVVNSKEEMLEFIAKAYELSVENGCTYFDITIDTNDKKET
jgi:hypothetical protein